MIMTTPCHIDVTWHILAMLPRVDEMLKVVLVQFWYMLHFNPAKRIVPIKTSPAGSKAQKQQVF